MDVQYLITTEEDLRSTIRNTYARLARPNATTRGRACCECGVAYSKEQCLAVPPDAIEVSAGCGNPLELVEIRPGQTIVDLGSGGGIDAFHASARVGPQGKVIGIDSTPEMVWRARETAKKAGISNVEFRLGGNGVPAAGVRFSRRRHQQLCHQLGA